MFDTDAVVGFEWDGGNARKNVDKHGVSRTEAEQIFFNEPLVVSSDERHSGSEERLHALGQSDVGRLLHLTFVLRRAGTMIRVISARPMSRKERVVYAKV